VNQVTKFMSQLEHASNEVPNAVTSSADPTGSGRQAMRKLALEWDDFIRTGRTASMKQVSTSWMSSSWCCKRPSNGAPTNKKSNQRAQADPEPMNDATVGTVLAAVQVKIENEPNQVPDVEFAIDPKMLETIALKQLPVHSGLAVQVPVPRHLAQVQGNAVKSSIPCELFEPALMRRTFGALLRSICSYQDEVERANEAKRHFIRYIFHEVRVPFNSVVLCKL